MALNWFRCTLKFAYSLMALAVVVIVMYAFGVFDDLPVHISGLAGSPGFWFFSAFLFVYSALGMGICLFLIGYICHITADTENNCCLHLYLIIVLILHLVEAYLVAQVFFKGNLVEGFPKDSAEDLDKIENFAEDDNKLYKWIGLLMILSAVLALVLKPLRSRNTTVHAPDRAPLLQTRVPQTSDVVDDPSVY